jgi:uncharacterized metal-binding protein
MKTQNSKTGEALSGNQSSVKAGIGETVTIRSTTAICGLCENYVEAHHDRRYAVVSCEGACLRGEISRRAANILCHRLASESTVRICSGSALTMDSGQRSLLRNASKVLILEGCSLECASRSLEAVVPTMKPVLIQTDGLADFDRNLFGLNELDEREIAAIAEKVAQKVLKAHIQ